MNIVFWLGIFVAAAILWYLLSGLFYRIGSNARGIVDDVKNEFNRTEEDEQEENESGTQK